MKMIQIRNVPDATHRTLKSRADLPLNRYEMTAFLHRMRELRHCMTPYDAAYVSLSEALDAPLVTCDARIARAHGHVALVELIDSAFHRRQRRSEQEPKVRLTRPEKTRI